MRFAGWLLFWGIALGLTAWMTDLDDMIRASIAAGHLLDWLMGAFCFLWLLLILKVPWDLFFQAQQVRFELSRAQERGIAVPAGRGEYLRGLQRKLGWLAIGAHLVSAAVVALATFFSQGQIGTYFAGFYLVSTAFRPLAAGYVILTRKLRGIEEETFFPREDAVALRLRVETLEEREKQAAEELRQEAQARAEETRELRQNVHALTREFETTLSRLTDNQEVIKGVQAFVRLIHQANGS